MSQTETKFEISMNTQYKMLSENATSTVQIYLNVRSKLVSFVRLVEEIGHVAMGAARIELQL